MRKFREGKLGEGGKENLFPKTHHREKGGNLGKRRYWGRKITPPLSARKEEARHRGKSGNLGSLRFWGGEVEKHGIRKKGGSLGERRFGGERRS